MTKLDKQKEMAELLIYSLHINRLNSDIFVKEIEKDYRYHNLLTDEVLDTVFKYCMKMTDYCRPLEDLYTKMKYESVKKMEWWIEETAPIVENIKVNTNQNYFLLIPKNEMSNELLMKIESDNRYKICFEENMFNFIKSDNKSNDVAILDFTIKVEKYEIINRSE